MLIGLRNAMLGGKRLPYKKRLEYIESTGTQYIDTGVFVTVNTGFDIIAKFNSTAFGLFGCTMYASSDPNWTRFQFGRRDNVAGTNSLFWGIWTKNMWISGTSIDFSKEHTFRYDSEAKRFYVDYQEYNAGVGGEFFFPSSSQSFYLFGNHDRDEAINLLCSATCSGAKFYDNGILINDLIPVLDINGEPKMFDQVTQTYPTHYGSFVAGPDASAVRGGV